MIILMSAEVLLSRLRKTIKQCIDKYISKDLRLFFMLTRIAVTLISTLSQNN